MAVAGRGQVLCGVKLLCEERESEERERERERERGVNLRQMRCCHDLLPVSPVKRRNRERESRPPPFEMFVDSCRNGGRQTAVCSWCLCPLCCTSPLLHLTCERITLSLSSFCTHTKLMDFGSARGLSRGIVYTLMKRFDLETGYARR